jgi:predicted nuclease of predicted toxin-antitoxin system
LRQILADENIPRDAIEWLTKNGFYVADVSRMHLERAKDYAIAEYAARNSMALITLDKGFAQLFRLFQKGTLTIILIKANPATPANIIEILNVAKQKINLKEIQGKLVIVTRKRIRIIS